MSDHDNSVPDPEEVLERNIAVLRDYLSEDEAREAEAMLRRQYSQRLRLNSRIAALRRFLNSMSRQQNRT